jgi:hypothetical protein
LSATAVKFPTLLVGNISQKQDVTLTNTGSDALSISKIAVDDLNFAVTNTCGSSVPAAGSCVLSVYETPTTSGVLAGFVEVFDDGGGSPQLITLSGNGTIVQLSRMQLNFGSVPVGQSSGPQRFRLKNTGDNPLNITGISIVGPNAGDFSQFNACGTMVVPGASCEIQVMFAPTAVGSRRAKVSIRDDGGGSPQLVQLGGQGT